VVYLEDWLRSLFQREPSNPFLAVLAPLIFTDTELTTQAPALWRTITEAKIAPHHRDRLGALLEYWFMERFRTLSLTEIRKMFQMLTPLQETRAYQEIFAEGQFEGKIEGKIESLKRLLARRFGSIPDWAEKRISQADGDQLDLWLDAVLDSVSLEEVFG
jgi:predicted transposase YdaD